MRARAFLGIGEEGYVHDACPILSADVDHPVAIPGWRRLVADGPYQLDSPVGRHFPRVLDPGKPLELTIEKLQRVAAERQLQQLQLSLYPGIEV